MTAATPGQAAYEARRDAFYEFLASQGYDDQGRFDHDEMELAFETGWQIAHAAIAAQDARPAPDVPGRPTTSLEDAMLRNVDGLNDLVRDMLQSFPDTADEQQWRDRAGALNVCDPDGQPYRAYTEEDL